MPKHATVATAAALIMVSAIACNGVIGAGGSGADGDSRSAGETGESDRGVRGPASAGPAPLRRLTANEYRHSVRDLFGASLDRRVDLRELPGDERVGGYAANARTPVDRETVIKYVELAEAIAEEVRWDAAVSCDHAETSCAVDFLSSFGRRAFRRPLTTEEQARFTATYETSRAEFGADAGLEFVVAGILASPNFLYLAEAPAGALPGSVVSLDDWAIAARLSYFLWASTPDEELLEAAAAGTLDGPRAIEAQARRMLDDDRAGDGIAAFHEQWLELHELGVTDEELAESMRGETIRFAQDVILRGDARFETLMTASYSFVDEALAEIYGVEVPTAPGARTELPPDERAGLLTQAAVLSRAGTTIVLRGKLVREKFLCDPIPPPPVEVDFSVSRLENESCRGCHTLMDPIGFAFTPYDAIGAFAPGEVPAEVTAEIVPARPDEEAVAGPVEDAVELAHRLATSDTVRACVADQWLRYATRRYPAAEDEESRRRLYEVFESTGGDIRELLVAIAVSDSFRLATIPRPEGE